MAKKVISDTNDDWFKSIFGEKESIRWYHYFIHLGYYIPYWIGFFFSAPFKEKRKDINILDTVSSLLESETTPENLDKCKELVHLHRIVENTKARRRLEKWSLRVIAIYLFIVLTIVVCNYIAVPLLSGYMDIHVTEPIMITILSTTTVNIIGLGLIVLKGHFLANDKSNSMSKKDNQEEPSE